MRGKASHQQAPSEPSDQCQKPCDGANGGYGVPEGANCGHVGPRLCFDWYVDIQKTFKEMR